MQPQKSTTEKELPFVFLALDARQHPKLKSLLSLWQQWVQGLKFADFSVQVLSQWGGSLQAQQWWGSEDIWNHCCIQGTQNKTILGLLQLIPQHLYPRSLEVWRWLKLNYRNYNNWTQESLGWTCFPLSLKNCCICKTHCPVLRASHSAQQLAEGLSSLFEGVRCSSLCKGLPEHLRSVQLK